MKILYFSLLFLFVSGFTFAEGNQVKTEINQLTVEINYGEIKPPKTVTIIWEEQLTALEALQKAALVTTHPVGNHVFVTAIDEVVATRGEMAWYYKINGKNPKALAIHQLINAGDTISWRYVKDICSATVDGEEK